MVAEYDSPKVLLSNSFGAFYGMVNELGAAARDSLIAIANGESDVVSAVSSESRDEDDGVVATEPESVNADLF